MIDLKQHLNKMLTLNAEFMSATPDRRKQIEQEIIAMVPKQKNSPSKELNELGRLQGDLKDKINKLSTCANKADFEVYFRQLDQLDEKICAHAKRMGADLPRTDYGKMMSKLLEAKFGN